MTQIELIIIPALVQVALTFALLFWLGPARVGALRRGEVQMKDIALDSRAWPDRITQIANAYANQFQLPVLFYVLVLFAVVLRKADMVLIAGSWLFVVSRCMHAFIHTTSNDVLARFRAFVVGVFTLAGMWIWFAVRLATG